MPQHIVADACYPEIANLLAAMGIIVLSCWFLHLYAPQTTSGPEAVAEAKSASKKNAKQRKMRNKKSSSPSTTKPVIPKWPEEEVRNATSLRYAINSLFVFGVFLLPYYLIRAAVGDRVNFLTAIDATCLGDISLVPLLMASYYLARGQFPTNPSTLRGGLLLFLGIIATEYMAYFLMRYMASESLAIQTVRSLSCGLSMIAMLSLGTATFLRYGRLGTLLLCLAYATMQPLAYITLSETPTGTSVIHDVRYRDLSSQARETLTAPAEPTAAISAERVLSGRIQELYPFGALSTLELEQATLLNGSIVNRPHSFRITYHRRPPRDSAEAHGAAQHRDYVADIYASVSEREGILRATKVLVSITLPSTLLYTLAVLKLMLIMSLLQTVRYYPHSYEDLLCPRPNSGTTPPAALLSVTSISRMSRQDGKTPLQFKDALPNHVSDGHKEMRHLLWCEHIFLTLVLGLMIYHIGHQTYVSLPASPMILLISPLLARRYKQGGVEPVAPAA